MEQELITIPPQTALMVFTTEGAIDPLLARVRAFTEGFVPDTSTKKGRAEIASRAFRVSQTKSHLETCGKALADQQKDVPRKIDATRRLIRETLDRLRDEIRKPLDEWETAEAARVAAHKASMASIRRRARPMHDRRRDPRQHHRGRGLRHRPGLRGVRGPIRPPQGRCAPDAPHEAVRAREVRGGAGRAGTPARGGGGPGGPRARRADPC